MLLFINACVRKDSRTRLLAERILSSAGEVTEITPIDLFPRTAHVECVTLLTKNV